MPRMLWQGRVSSFAAPSFSASSDFVLMLTSTAGRLGVPVHEALKRTRLPEMALAQRGVPISLLAAREAWSSISAASGDPVFGLRIAEQLEVGGLDLLDFVTRSSATWGDAVNRFVRYAPLVAQAGTMSLLVEGNRVRFRHHVHGGLRIVSEMILGLLLRLRAVIEELRQPWFGRPERHVERIAREHELVAIRVEARARYRAP